MITDGSDQGQWSTLACVQPGHTSAVSPRSVNRQQNHSAGLCHGPVASGGHRVHWPVKVAMSVTAGSTEAWTAAGRESGHCPDKESTDSEWYRVLWLHCGQSDFLWGRGRGARGWRGAALFVIPTKTPRRRTTKKKQEEKPKKKTERLIFFYT